MSSSRKAAVLAAVFGLCLWAGCVAAVGPGGVAVGPAPVAVATDYYTPLYYNGYVVYYDSLGRPIYYVGGVMYYVPTTYIYYGRLVAHYSTYRVHYHRWYRARGHRYRAYRRSGYRRYPHRGHPAPGHRGHGGRGRGGGGHRRGR